MKKRIVAGVMVAAMAVSALGGCTGKEKSATQEKGQVKKTAAKGVTHLRIATSDNAYEPASYTNHLPVMKEIEKATHTKIDWEVSPNSQYETYTQTILAAGEDMPDIMCNMYGQDLRSLYESGLIIDLKPLIDSVGGNTKRYLEEHPDIKAMITEKDGKILNLPTIQDDKNYTHGFMIRKDWLDKLHLEVPRTSDELIEVLRAFRDQDPNGNHEKDEIPTSVIGTHFLDYSWPYMFSCIPGYDFDVDESGKVFCPAIGDNYKEFLKYMHGLYKEGLLDSMFANRTDEEWRTLISTNKVGFIQGWINSLSLYNQNKGEEWIPISVPTGPSGESFSVSVPKLAAPAFITKDCKNPEAAFKLLDYAWASEDGLKLANYGVEGTSYNMVDGKPQFTDFVLKNKDGLSTKEALFSIGSIYRLPRIDLSAVHDATASADTKKWNEDNKKVMRDCYPGSEIIMTPEETKEKAELGYTDMVTYKEEMKARFVMGKDDIDKTWKSYVKKLKDMGIDKVIKIEQAKYDRYIKAEKEVTKK